MNPVGALKSSGPLWATTALLGLLVLAGQRPPHDCRSCGAAWADVYESVRQSVVTVECLLPEDEGYQEVLSGVAVAPGKVVTVGLKPVGESPVVCIRTPSGRVFAATWVGLDDETGVSLLKTSERAAPPVPLRQDIPPVGSPVLVIGNPYGLTLSAKLGNISGLGRQVRLGKRSVRGLMQLCVPIHLGDSGAPVCDCAGRMVGLVRSGLAATSEPGSASQAALTGTVPGIAFVVPTPELLAAIQRIEDKAHLPKGLATLGLVVQAQANAQTPGLRIEKVLPGSEAEGCALEPGDVLRTINGQPVSSVEEAERLLANALSKNETLRLTVQRGNKDWTVVLPAPGKTPPPAPVPSTGSDTPQLLDRGQDASGVDQFERRLKELREELRQLEEELQQIRSKNDS
jgi:serine protease Do